MELKREERLSLKDVELEKLADYYADNCSYPQPDEHFKTTYWIQHKIAVDAFKAGAIWQQSQQPEIEKLISDYKYLLVNFTSCPQIIIDNPSFVQGKKPTEKDMEWAREKIKEYEADLQSQQPKESDGWISVEDRLPDNIGNYWCKNQHAEFPCFYIRNYKGDLIWLKVHEDVIITHWKQK